MTWINPELPAGERRYGMFLLALYLLFPLAWVLACFWLVYAIWDIEYAYYALPVAFVVAFLVRRLSARSLSRQMARLEVRVPSDRFDDED